LTNTPFRAALDKPKIATFAQNRTALNHELFIARRIFKGGKGSFTRPIINISVASVSLGIAVLILAVAILKGFQLEIRDKIIGFGGHIQVSYYDNNSSFEVEPIVWDPLLAQKIAAIPGVTHVQPYGIKAAIIKNENQIEGVVLKGVDHDYHWDFFREKVIEGNIPVLDTATRSNEVLISRHTARKMGLNLDDKVILHFVQDPPRYRSMTIAGIYETGLQDFDEIFLFGDIRHIARLNDWEPGQVSGFEVLINDFKNLERITQAVDETLPFDLLAESIRDRNPQLFGWLELMDQNVVIILIITLLVALIHMTSTLLIMIIERTNMIGVLKALGMNNLSLRRLFLINGGMLLLKGIVYGNLFAVGIGLLQQYGGFLKLDQESYYLDKVPVHLALGDILLVNSGILVICILVMIIPSWIIGRIAPIKAIRYD
jgi:lipoprotein-releasing system permease protein